MKQQELEQLLLEIADLNSDYQYISYKAPQLKEKMQSIIEVPKSLRDEFDDALREIEYISNSI